MGYRLPTFSPQPSDPKSERWPIVDHAAQSVIWVDNGTISRIPIPCFYQYRNDLDRLVRMRIDHLGWPSPDHPDESCQYPTAHDVVYEPIDLETEGYNAVVVALGSPPSGLTVSGQIDYNLVTLSINAMCSSAATADVEVPINVYVTGSKVIDGVTYQLRDVVTKGLLHIVSGLIS